MLTNLLANAAKFTDPGGHIRITAEAPAGQIVLRVRDNGRGIGPDLLLRVFDRFWLASEGKAAGGLGLGLAQVKSLVELLGGSVSARSDGLGAGAEFCGRLPDVAQLRRRVRLALPNRRRPRSPLPSTAGLRLARASA